MIERVERGDAVKFAIVDEDAIRVRGIVRDRAGNYIRITVLSPEDYPDITVEIGDDYGPGITACRDYSMEVLGIIPYVTVETKNGYATVIHAK